MLGENGSRRLASFKLVSWCTGFSLLWLVACRYFRAAAKLEPLIDANKTLMDGAW